MKTKLLKVELQCRSWKTHKQILVKFQQRCKSSVFEKKRLYEILPIEKGNQKEIKTKKKMSCNNIFLVIFRSKEGERQMNEHISDVLKLVWNKNSFVWKQNKLHFGCII